MKNHNGKTGVIFDIKKFAVHDGPGIRSTVFLKGCPLRCRWCHNPESLYLNGFYTSRIDDNSSLLNFCEFENKIAGKEISADLLLTELLKDKLFYEESGGGVTFSGGEPLLQIDFLRNMLKKCKDELLHTVVDTSGYSDFAKLSTIYPFTDLFLYDLKLLDEDEHLKYTGVSNESILKNLIELSKLGNKINVRIPLIPDITDTKKNLTRIIEFLSGLENKVPVHLLPYNVIGEDKYRRFNLEHQPGRLLTQSESKLNEIANNFLTAGFEIKFRG